MQPGTVPLLELRRGGYSESIHAGAAAVVDDSGRLIASAGDPDFPIFLRSAAKPFQALPLIESGAADRFGVSSDELAVIAGSHAGEARHLLRVTRLLAKGGFSSSALRCGVHTPFSMTAQAALHRRNAAATVLHNNCSGKHAGMLLLARHWGQPAGTYLEPGSRVQAAIRAAIAAAAGVSLKSIQTAVDGCSAPTFRLALSNVALAYARLAAAPPGSPLGRIATAMTAHPELTPGTGRVDTALMALAAGRWVAKGGAEGVQAVGVRLKKGRVWGIAIKAADGNSRPLVPVLAEILRQLRVLDRVTAARLERMAGKAVRNWEGAAVGEWRPVFRLKTVRGWRG